MLAILVLTNAGGTEFNKWRQRLGSKFGLWFTPILILETL